MKKLLIIACLLLCVNAQAQQRYFFFLHNMWVELNGLDVPHPEYGKVEYYQMLDKFSRQGFYIMSEIRPEGTNGNVYAVKVAHQVDSLLKLGIPASNITVAGTSKGGFITMFTSGILKNPDINYVLIGCCEEGSLTDDSVHLYGNILSIYEKSDRFHSCQKQKAKKGNNVKRFKEIELNTGLKHGFLYKAMDEWIVPASKWAKGNYN